MYVAKIIVHEGGWFIYTYSQGVEIGQVHSKRNGTVYPLVAGSTCSLCSVHSSTPSSESWNKARHFIMGEQDQSNLLCNKVGNGQ